MSSARDNLIVALEGEIPEHIPYTAYIGDFLPDDPAWEGLYAHGLCATGWAHTFRQIAPDLGRVVTQEPWGGYTAERVTLRTPVGEISQLSVTNELSMIGWVQEYFLKSPDDYRVMEHVVRNTQVEPYDGSFLAEEEKVGDGGITLVATSRSPMQTILVDYAGLEHFTFHLAEGFPELFALAEALMDGLVKECEIVAAGPGRYVSLPENFTAEHWGPRRFARHHMPVYERILPILHSGGKRVYPHLDGKLGCVADLLAETAFDGVESLTEPPEGDVTYAQARAAWPDKFIWANINVSLYDLPPQALKSRVQEMACQASADGRLLAFEISEDLPQNWRESIPIVLEALETL